MVEITIDTDGAKGDKTAKATATDGHPFWVPELGEWINATDLRSGDSLETGTGTRVRITGVKRWTQQAAVYNLTVADIHTYYVVAGAAPVLVHNCGDLDKDQGIQGAHPKDHLDISDNDLVNRAQTDPTTNVASMLHSSQAQARINDVVNHHRTAINKWAAKATSGDRREFSLGFASPIGRVADNSGAVRDAQKLTLVLMRVEKGYQGHKGAWVLFTVKAS